MPKEKAFVIGTILVVILYLGINKFIVYPFLTKDQDLKLAPKTNRVILGASHGRLGINPEIIGSTENLCVKGETLLLTFKKLELILKKDNNLKQVILTVSPSTFSYSRDVDNFTNETFINRQLLYEYLLDSQALAEFSKNENFAIKRRNKYLLGIIPPQKDEWVSILKLAQGDSRKNALTTWGKFEPSYGVHLEDYIVEDAIERHYFNKKHISSNSLFQQKYFNEILKLCESKEIQLVLLRVPESEKYKKLIPEYHRDLFDSTLHAASDSSLNRYSLDYSQLTLPDSLFFDGDHLNLTGSAFFSTLLFEDLSFR